MNEASVNAPSLHNPPLNELGHRVQEVISFVSRHPKEVAVSSLSLAVLTLGSWYFITQKAPDISPVQTNAYTSDNPIQPNLDNLLIPDTNIYPGVLATQTNTPISTPTETPIPTATMGLFTNSHHNSKNDEGKFPPTATATSTPTEKPQPTATPTEQIKNPKQKKTEFNISPLILEKGTQQDQAHAKQLLAISKDVLKTISMDGFFDYIVIADPNDSIFGSKNSYSWQTRMIQEYKVGATTLEKGKAIAISTTTSADKKSVERLIAHELTHALIPG
ncbi:hypothetical protein M1437_04440, partial [Patescibacteria group bacterium]|nr:hypothetical protein [Patescibacteria group bacterium]